MRVAIIGDDGSLENIISAEQSFLDSLGKVSVILGDGDNPNIGDTHNQDGTFTTPAPSMSACVEKAENLVKRNYKTFKQGGITYTNNAVDYNIEYTDKTIQNVFNKSIILNGLPPSTVLSWTMDTPREKITFLDASDLQVFLTSLGILIEVNHNLYLDKITEVNAFSTEEVTAFINTPSYPTYTNIII